ncbi:MAG: hypothetical protein IKI05_03350 [Bacteroidaceae bacterium]|nr:hypothetical protein [Bacteroidaceae bacterium]
MVSNAMDDAKFDFWINSIKHHLKHTSETGVKTLLSQSTYRGKHVIVIGFADGMDEAYSELYESLFNYNKAVNHNVQI